LAELLASFPYDHPAVSSYDSFFTDIATDDDAELVETWFGRRAHFLHNPLAELTALMVQPLGKLQDSRPVSMSRLEWNRRVLSVGRAMLQVLEIQHGLQEPLDLNGDTFEDLATDSIEYIELESDAALRTMFLATKPKVLSHKKYWDRTAFGKSLVNFDFDHTFLDTTYRPAMYRRNHRREIHGPPIAVDIPTNTEDEQIAKKIRPRTDSDDDDSEDSRAPKRQATGRTLRARRNKGTGKKPVVAVPGGKVVASGKGWVTIEVEDNDN
jgi:hypothetical protein